MMDRDVVAFAARLLCKGTHQAKKMSWMTARIGMSLLTSLRMLEPYMPGGTGRESDFITQHGSPVERESVDPFIGTFG